MAYLKKTISLLLVFTMLCGILPWTAGAEETKPVTETSQADTVSMTPPEETEQQETFPAEEEPEELPAAQETLPVEEKTEEIPEPTLEAIDVREPQGEILPEDLAGEQGEELLESIGGEELPAQPEILEDEQEMDGEIVTGSVMDAAYPDPPAEACALSELTTEDYLAFSSLAYLDFDNYAYAFESGYESIGSYITVQDALVSMGLWNANWSERLDITYAQLCSHIAGWRVLTYHNHSNEFGFYAVVFQNENREAVIAYRGSVPPDKISDSKWDALQDWLVYDLNAEYFKTVTKVDQYASAFETYRKVADAGRSTSTIAVTGHSLGGGLANLVAARYGCTGESMNAISLLDTLFYAEPVAMAENFTGIENWTFTDHANECDIAAGMFEYYVGVRIKPYQAYQSNATVFPPDMIKAHVDTCITQAGAVTSSLAIYDLASSHSMDSMVQLNSSGTVSMTPTQSTFRVKSAKTSNLDAFRAVDFGTAADNNFTSKFLDGRTRTIIGGNGNDYMTGTNGNDKFVGGKGNDTMIGDTDDDNYIYYKGDGYDTIQDTDGWDRLYMFNFNSSDGITVVTDSSYDYVYVKLGSTDLVRIAKKGRRASLNDTFEIIIENTDGTQSKHDISGAFHYKDYWGYLDVACPVSVEILDAEGNVVFTVEDGAVGYHITDYGNFFVYEEEDGTYGKHLELVEGYTARILGEDTGTMDVSYVPVTEEGAGEITSVTDVPVSTAFTAEIQLEQTGEATLVMDTDGDGSTDMITEITNPCGENLTWLFDEATGTLTIHGEGSLYDFTAGAPWDAFKTDITGVVIEEGVTGIGSNAFAGCTALKDIRFAADAPTIGANAFQNVTATAVYPAGNATWTADVLQNYGGTVLWKGVCYGEHTVVTDPEVAPTCTKTGLTEGSHCSACGTVIVAQNTVPFTGHTEAADEAVAATCTETGLTAGKHCSVCNAVITAQKTTAALGHTYENGVDGTCNRCGVNRETTENRTSVNMFRMYDPNSGEHFYTGSEEERENLVEAGWNYEGVGFTFSLTTGAPVYRLYDPIYGEHLYTMDEAERDTLMAAGWNLEGIAFNSAYDTEVAQFRLHNPNEKRGAYHFTASTEERDNLIAAGWEYQGIGFYSAWK